MSDSGDRLGINFGVRDLIDGEMERDLEIAVKEGRWRISNRKSYFESCWRTREISDGGETSAMEEITDRVNGNWEKGRGHIRRIGSESTYNLGGNKWA